MVRHRDITKMFADKLNVREAHETVGKCSVLRRCRPGHTKFLFSGQKKFEISGHFSGHQSHKKRVFFVISGAYNFGTFRADAKITIR